jgi:hypothetical protein
MKKKQVDGKSTLTEHSPQTSRKLVKWELSNQLHGCVNAEEMMLYLRLVFLVRDGNEFRAFDDFALDFPWPAKEDFHDADTVAKAFLALAEELGLLVPGAQAELADLDG